MSDSDVHPHEMRRHPHLDDETVERLLAGVLHAEDLDPGSEAVSALVHEVKAAFAARPAPPPSVDLERVFATGLTTDKGDLPATAASNADGPARAQAAGLPKWRTSARRTRRKMLTFLSTLAGTVAGKVAMGTAVAAAAVGGAHASGVDVPLLPSDDTVVVTAEVDTTTTTVVEDTTTTTVVEDTTTTTVVDGTTDTSLVDDSSTTQTEDDSFGKRVSADATGESDGVKGVDGRQISEEAKAKGGGDVETESETTETEAETGTETESETGLEAESDDGGSGPPAHAKGGRS